MSKIETVAYPQYRCRRCGKVFTRVLMELTKITDAVRSANYANLMYTVNEVKQRRRSRLSGTDPIRILDMHICSENARGVIDLIGTTPPIEAMRSRNKWLDPQTKEEIPYQLEG